jgi:hypothetical protein
MKKKRHSRFRYSSSSSLRNMMRKTAAMPHMGAALMAFLKKMSGKFTGALKTQTEKAIKQSTKTTPNVQGKSNAAIRGYRKNPSKKSLRKQERKQNVAARNEVTGKTEVGPKTTEADLPISERLTRRKASRKDLGVATHKRDAVKPEVRSVEELRKEFEERIEAQGGRPGEKELGVNVHKKQTPPATSTPLKTQPSPATSTPLKTQQEAGEARFQTATQLPPVTQSQPPPLDPFNYHGQSNLYQMPFQPPPETQFFPQFQVGAHTNLGGNPTPEQVTGGGFGLGGLGKLMLGSAAFGAGSSLAGKMLNPEIPQQYNAGVQPGRQYF